MLLVSVLSVHWFWKRSVWTVLWWLWLVLVGILLDLFSLLPKSVGVISIDLVSFILVLSFNKCCIFLLSSVFNPFHATDLFFRGYLKKISGMKWVYFCISNINLISVSFSSLRLFPLFFSFDLCVIFSGTKIGVWYVHWCFCVCYSLFRAKFSVLKNAS